MRTIGIVIAVNLSVVLETAVGQTTNYAGTWSNKKPIYTEGFRLRHDGRGVLNATYDNASFLRWTNTTGGIAIIVAGNSKSSLFRYDVTTDRLISCDGGMANQVFVRINTNEPPDAEGDYEARLEREHAERMRTNPPPPPTIIATTEEFRNHVMQFASQNKSISGLNIASVDKKHFLLCKVNNLTSIMLTTVIAGTFPKVTGTYSGTVPEGQYKTITLVPEDRVIEFRQWLDGHGAKNNVGYYLFRSPWKIEGYRQFCEVNIASNNTLFVDAVLHLVEKTLTPFEFPIEAR